MPLQAIGRPFELLHALVVGIIHAIQTSDRTSEVLAEIIRITLDVLDQIAKVDASRTLRAGHRLLHTSRRLHDGNFLDNLLQNNRLWTSLLDSLLDHDRLRDRLYGLHGTGRLRNARILPERHQPKARKGRDHQTRNGIPELSFHNLLHVSSSSQLPRTTARRRVGPRCLRNCASATLHRPSYHRLTIALSSGGYGCNGGAKIRSRVASSDRYRRGLI